MELSANKSHNKENNNPVLVPTQYEIMQKEGIFAKTKVSPHYRFYYRKQRQSLIQPIQNPIIAHSNSSQSIHKDIVKIAKQLQSQHIQTINPFNFTQPLKERHSTQYSNPPNQQINEVMEMFEKENLMKIQQIKPYTPIRPFTQYINSKLPTLNYENTSNDLENSEKETPLLKNKLLFKRTINPSLDKIKKINQPIIEIRHKRVASQNLQNPIIQHQQKSINGRTNKILNQHKIMSIYNKISNIQEQIAEEQLLDLINSDHFKIEFQHFINNNSQGSHSDMEKLLQKFLIDQITKMKELQEAENNLEEKRQNFQRSLTNYIQELKDKL